ncbi:AmmeMemoRadiSam system radical SAM enzyme [Magnetospira sp. QH-2]|uniref:AmmeMemoRadiSam system radical SAM enzyme n=1 Tax=Magnetospira sp. (strain QH-2) TaxID=1288970 RepID=UPI0003E8102B|nr:AmmeMemoRadiSam system radical SAM enzyme [Magnetospira sp. QH-2]CCQ72830.1 Pyruvate-formate lyase-activating enzyme [Magnetospira sp. QH-2]
MFHRTRYWTRENDGRIRCDLCPRACKLRNGQLGLCFNRAAVNGEIVLTTYGQSSGFCIDPIEKKPLNHFLPGTPILSLGSVGCNLTCKFCQNWSISKGQEDLLKALTESANRSSNVFEQLLDNEIGRDRIVALAGIETDPGRLLSPASPKLIAKAAAQTNCRSVAFTYNDPVIFHEYVIDTAKACHARGLKTVAVTAGYICPEPRREFFAHMDAANVDLKAFTEDFYHRLCTATLADTLDTLKYLIHETDVWVETTTLLIPGENDSAEEIDAMTRWVVAELGPDMPMHFSAFHPDWKMRDKPRTPHASLIRARDIALANGVRHAYVGNVHDLERESTYCHQCGTRLVGRDWYVLSSWNLDPQGRCLACKAACAGVFNGPPGDWGAKRVPLRLSH